MILKEWLKQYCGIKDEDISIEYVDNLKIKLIKIRSAAEGWDERYEKIKEILPDNIKIIWEKK